MRVKYKLSSLVRRKVGGTKIVYRIALLNKLPQVGLLQSYGVAASGSSQSGVGKIFPHTTKDANWLGSNKAKGAWLINIRVINYLTETFLCYRYHLSGPGRCSVLYIIMIRLYCFVLGKNLLVGTNKGHLLVYEVREYGKFDPIYFLVSRLNHTIFIMLNHRMQSGPSPFILWY